MTPDEETFVADMGQFLGASGMTPMAGRMWGWLLICDPPEQTADELATQLHASRGAISGTARMLQTAGLIRRTTRRGDRREYFSVPPGTFDALIIGAGKSFRRFVQLTGQGLELLRHRPPAARERLREVHDAYAFLDREFPALIQRFKDHQISDDAPSFDEPATRDRVSA
jgi:DNA-binding transcriptional regulator GbsR (MarR family)